MKMIPVESSNIKAVGYDVLTFTLRTEFHNGTTYEYAGVPIATYEAVVSAESIGKTFNALIKKGGYPYKKVES